MTWQEYAAAWSRLHGGFDPESAAPVVRGWIRLAYRGGSLLGRLRISPATVTLCGLLLCLAVPFAALLGRSGLLLGALATGEYHLLRVAMQDRLHQPYRSHLIPGLEDVIDAALAGGAHGACLSGSGPTVLAFAPEERARTIAATMQSAFEARDVKADAWALDVDLAGARVEPPEEVIPDLPVPVL